MFHTLPIKNSFITKNLRQHTVLGVYIHFVSIHNLPAYVRNFGPAENQQTKFAWIKLCQRSTVC